jgi:hypothetical protein
MMGQRPAATLRLATTLILTSAAAGFMGYPARPASDDSPISASNLA